MPGIFGVIGNDLSGSKRLHDLFSDIWGSSELINFDMGMIGGHSFCNTPALHNINDREYLVVDGEESIYRHAQSYSQQNSPLLYDDYDGKIKLTSFAKGNIALWQKDKKKFYLLTDHSGIFPLYYFVKDNRLAFCSHLRPLSKILDSKCDHVGMIEFLRYGYFLAGRTHFKNIRRLEPGQALVFDAQSGDLEIYENSSCWSTNELQVNSNEVVDLFWTTLNNAIRRCLLPDQQNVLMASAGWDSRILLAGMRKFANLPNLECYTHGDPLCREIAILERMLMDTNVKFHSEPLQESMYDIGLLNKGFNRVENLLFPHWHKAGEILSIGGTQTVSAGVLGEVFGGHYGIAMLMSGFSKLKALAPQLLNTNTANGLEVPVNHKKVHNLLSLKNIEKPWYMKEDYWQSIAVDIKENINCDIEKSLIRLENRGVNNDDQLIEAFITESRGVQYISSQLLALRANLNINNIFGDQELFNLSSHIPFSMKIHNRLNRAVLKKYDKLLLNYPTAAILVPAYAPILLQEATRGIRKLMEYKPGLIPFSKTYIKEKRYGWDNFSFLSDGNVLSDLVNEFKVDFVDYGKVNSHIDKIRNNENIDLYSVSGHFMKIMTVDLMFRK